MSNNSRIASFYVYIFIYIIHIYIYIIYIAAKADSFFQPFKCWSQSAWKEKTSLDIHTYIYILYIYIYVCIIIDIYIYIHTSCIYIHSRQTKLFWTENHLPVCFQLRGQLQIPQQTPSSFNHWIGPSYHPCWCEGRMFGKDVWGRIHFWLGSHPYHPYLILECNIFDVWEGVFFWFYSPRIPGFQHQDDETIFRIGEFLENLRKCDCFLVGVRSKLVGGWTNPFQKIWSSKMASSSPNFRGENKKYLSCHHLARENYLLSSKETDSKCFFFEAKDLSRQRMLWPCQNTHTIQKNSFGTLALEKLNLIHGACRSVFHMCLSTEAEKQSSGCLVVSLQSYRS